MNTREVSIKTWTRFHNYLLENSPLAHAFRCAHDITHVEKTVVIMPEDEPRNGHEPFIVLGNTKNLYHPARLAYVAVPLEGEEIYLKANSRMCDIGSYPLFYVEGVGGWFCKTR